MTKKDLIDAIIEAKPDWSSGSCPPDNGEGDGYSCGTYNSCTQCWEDFLTTRHKVYKPE